MSGNDSKGPTSIGGLDEMAETKRETADSTQPPAVDATPDIIPNATFNSALHVEAIIFKNGRMIENVDEIRKFVGLLRPPYSYNNVCLDVLVTTTTEWDEWLSSINAGFPISNIDCVPQALFQDTVQELDKILGDIKYPRFLASFRSTNSFIGETKYVEKLRDWAVFLKPENFEGEGVDTYHFSALHSALLLAWACMNESDGENEASQRKGADSLIQLAFQMRSGAKHSVSFEVDVAMPVNPEMRIQVPYANADAVATLPFPGDLTPKLVNDLREHFRLHWSVIANNGSYVNLPISILSFLVEEKRFETPPNQLAMCFTAALYHRRALGLPDMPVFGALVNNGKFKLFISGWSKDYNGKDIVKTRTSGHTWDLKDPAQFVQCVFFLCRLSDHIHDEMQSMFAGLDKHKFIRTIKEEAKNNAWRILDPKGKYDESEDEISASSSDDESGGYK